MANTDNYIYRNIIAPKLIDGIFRKYSEEQLRAALLVNVPTDVAEDAGELKAKLQRYASIDDGKVLNSLNAIYDEANSSTEELKNTIQQNDGFKYYIVESLHNFKYLVSDLDKLNYLLQMYVSHNIKNGGDSELFDLYKNCLVSSSQVGGDTSVIPQGTVAERIQQIEGSQEREPDVEAVVEAAQEVEEAAQEVEEAAQEVEEAAQEVEEAAQEVEEAAQEVTSSEAEVAEATEQLVEETEKLEEAVSTEYSIAQSNNVVYNSLQGIISGEGVVQGIWEQLHAIIHTNDLEQDFSQSGVFMLKMNTAINMYENSGLESTASGASEVGTEEVIAGLDDGQTDEDSFLGRESDKCKTDTDCEEGLTCLAGECTEIVEGLDTGDAEFEPESEVGAEEVAEEGTEEVAEEVAEEVIAGLDDGTKDEDNFLGKYGDKCVTNNDCEAKLVCDGEEGDKKCSTDLFGEREEESQPVPSDVVTQGVSTSSVPASEINVDAYKAAKGESCVLKEDCASGLVCDKYDKTCKERGQQHTKSSYQRSQARARQRPSSGGKKTRKNRKSNKKQGKKRVRFTKRMPKRN